MNFVQYEMEDVVRDHELETAVGRGKSKHGAVTVRGIERTLIKPTFDIRCSKLRAPMLDDQALLPAS